MRRLTLLFLVLAVLGSGTANAEVIYNPQPFGDFTIGLIDPNNPGTLNSVYVPDGMKSDDFQFTFGAHMDAIFYNTESLHFNFVYDNSSLEVLGARPVAPPGAPSWLVNNYTNFQWPNPSSGLVSVSTLFQSMGTGTTFQPMNTSSVVPFFQVTLHVKSDQPSQKNFFGITNMTLVSHTFALTLSPDVFTYYNGLIHEVPEPSSAMLLGACFAGIAGVTLRRRRR